MKESPCPQCGGGIMILDSKAECLNCSWQRKRHGRVFSDTEAGEPEGFSRQALARLEAMDGHFWTVERQRLTALLLQGMSGKKGRGLDMGCGTGNSLGIMEDCFQFVDAVDLYSDLLESAQRKTQKTLLYQGDVRSTGLPSDSYDFILSQDVIEHVNPDEFLTEARRLIKRGGHILLSAPASPRLWSRFDVVAGHRCRYTAGLLKEELRRNHWHPLGATHYQFLLYPLLWISRKLVDPSGISREQKPRRLEGWILSGITRLEVSLFHKYPLPYGASVFVWAEAV